MWLKLEFFLRIFKREMSIILIKKKLKIVLTSPCQNDTEAKSSKSQRLYIHHIRCVYAAPLFLWTKARVKTNRGASLGLTLLMMIWWSWAWGGGVEKKTPQISLGALYKLAPQMRLTNSCWQYGSLQQGVSFAMCTLNPFCLYKPTRTTNWR